MAFLFLIESFMRADVRDRAGGLDGSRASDRCPQGGDALRLRRSGVEIERGPTGRVRKTADLLKQLRVSPGSNEIDQILGDRVDQ
ncbi:hypothetical protein GCM10007973_32260 [Polymorphobacter multimanifer]|nr:hypothetical protein GCM10007973_32260 [Polymorphobacter multimanifer]